MIADAKSHQPTTALSLYKHLPLHQKLTSLMRVSCCTAMARNNRTAAKEEAAAAALYVRVMTDEQVEVLRRQIAAYATICEQLVEMHRTLTAHHDPLAGLRLGTLHCDPSMMPKISSRQRWTPKPMQLQILESIFDQGNGAPCKQKIKDITLELSQHGQISESNVYNWFQNRRARSKRKQTHTLPSNSESEAEAEIESPNEKKAKPDKIHALDKLLRVDNLPHQSTGTSYEVCSIDQESKLTQDIYVLNDISKSTGNLNRTSFYENDLSRDDRLICKIEIPGSSNVFPSGENYNRWM